MKKYLSLLAMAAIAAFAFNVEPAEAAKKRTRVQVTKQQDNRLRDASWGYGAASTGAYVAAGATTGAGFVTTIACFPLAPIVVTTVVQRELTMREAHVIFGNCVVPIVGGYLVNSFWDQYPHLTPDPKNSKRFAAR